MDLTKSSRGPFRNRSETINGIVYPCLIRFILKNAMRFVKEFFSMRSSVLFIGQCLMVLN